ncbi:MAG TPA: hypothetical protein VJS45_07250 [Acidimicrobiia bacterium]|nr:hypothetical protein [Acidimicrobiia bacterium]
MPDESELEGFNPFDLLEAGALDVDAFNAWMNDRWGAEPTADLLERWRAANAAFRAEMRARGRHGSVDSSIGTYPSWLQAFHLAAEYATHADDIGVEVPGAERPARTAWRVVLGRFVLAENDKAVTVRSVAPGRVRVRLGDEEAELSDEEFVEATQGRLADDHPLPPGPAGGAQHRAVTT